MPVHIESLATIFGMHTQPGKPSPSIEDVNE